MADFQHHPLEPVPGQRSATTVVVHLTDGRQIDLTGKDAGQIVDALKAQGITLDDIVATVHRIPDLRID